MKEPRSPKGLPMRRASCLFFLFVWLCVQVSGLSVQAGDPPHRAVAGPFTLSRDGGTPLVEVEFHNPKTGELKTGLFVIDTGAYDSIITRDFAKRLGYKQDANPAFLEELLSQSALVSSSVVHVSDMRIGRLRVSDITFQVAGGTIDSENGRPIDGLIGGTLLSRFALLLDYPHHTLSWVYPGNLDDATVTELGLDPKTGIGLHQDTVVDMGVKEDRYSTRVQLQDGDKKSAEEMFFDTGAPGSSLSSGSAERLKLVSTGLEPFSFALLRPDLANRSSVPTFQIGPQVFSDVSVIYPSHSGSYMVPLIGENVLGGCLVLFDFGPHRCFLKPVLPGMTPGPMPPLDTNAIDWERLRNAPEALSFPELLSGLLYPETLENVPQEMAHLEASPASVTGTTEHYARLGRLLHESGDDAGAKAALEEDVRLCRAEADAHPEDAGKASLWTDALVQAGQTSDALTAAEKDAAHWPASPAALRSLGLAQEARAAALLLGDLGSDVTKDATDDQALSQALPLKQKPGRPDPVRLQQIAALRQQARESYGQAVALAPLDPEGYNRRARFWLLDRLLLVLMGGLGVKGQSPSLESALAAELADYRTEARLRPDDAVVLRRVVLLDDALPQFHDDGWFRKNLRGTGQENELQNETQSSGPVTAKAALARLAVLSGSSDPKTAAAALEALGEAQADTDDPAAEATLRKALAQDPSRPGTLASLAALLVADNRLSALGDLLLKQSDEDATPASCLLLSGALSAVGQTATAEEEAREALKRLPDSPAANMALARLLLARSGDDPSVLPEASACLTEAETGLGSFASPAQKAGLQTLQAVRQALSGDPAGARTVLLQVVHDYPSCTQAREALYALTVPSSVP
jgi:tetratricopeptide (TPR) repeat protein